MSAGLLSAATTGLELAAHFHPIASLGGAVLAAALAARSERLIGPALVVAAAWAAGDGLRIAGHAQDALKGSGALGAATPAATWLALALWAAGGLAVGYAFPAWAGAFTGRRVTHGTGWLAAGAVAAAVSAGVAALAASLFA